MGIFLLHKENITHRDISLPNLLLFGDTIKLTDFETISKSDSLCSRRATGTLLFMSPEVLITFIYEEIYMEKDYPSQARDLWAEGVVMVYILEKFKPDWEYLTIHTCISESKCIRMYNLMNATTSVDRFGLMKLDPKERTPAAKVISQIEKELI